MRYSLATLALVAAAYASPAPQGVTSAVSPQSSAPAGCQSSYDGTFEIETVNATTLTKRDIAKRQSNVLQLTLNNGILLDNQGRTGYIADNSQFQFDKPAQTGAIYTAGWSVCANGSLAIGGHTLFKQCLSGDFYNLYLDNNAAQCSPIYIQVYSASGTTGGASQLPDGQPQATPKPLCQLADGQPQGTDCAPVSQISDGQIQATSARAPVTQIPDGQIQATSARAPVTQISDGQIQAPTSAKAPVTQISDGQIQAPTSKAPVTQISDGQVQAPTAASYTPTTTRAAVPYTGAASLPSAGVEFFGLAAGVLAVAMLDTDIINNIQAGVANDSMAFDRSFSR